MDLNLLSNLEVLALTIYGEARGELIEGQVAVGCVIRNRVSNLRNYKDVCFEKYQFSCWNQNDPNYSILTELAGKIVIGGILDIDNLALTQCHWVAQGIMNLFILDNTHGARNYMTTKLFVSGDVPQWARAMKTSAVIGNHSFLV